MKFLIVFLFIILVMPTVLAVGFSPTSLTFNLNSNQQECKKIVLNSESQSIIISDKWADDSKVDWNVALFNSTAIEHGLHLIYPPELSKNEREVEVCASGSKLGEYHGVIIMQQAQEGNSIIQLAVWLKIIIHNADSNRLVVNSVLDSSIEENKENKISAYNQSEKYQTGEEKNNTQNLSDRSGFITGNAISEFVFDKKSFIIPIIIIVLAFLGFYKYKKWKSKKVYYGYA